MLNILSSMGGPSHEVILLSEALKIYNDNNIKILDLGCGNGRNSFMLAGEGYNITAVDASEHDLATLERVIELYPREIKIVNTDARKFPFTGKFNCILAHGLLHFFSKPEIENIIKKIKDATQQGGVNIFTTAFSDGMETLPDAFVKQGHKNSMLKGELLCYYQDWHLISHERYYKWDYHPGLGNHSHPIEKYIFQKFGDNPIGLVANKLHLTKCIANVLISDFQKIGIIGKNIPTICAMFGVPDFQKEYVATGPQFSFRRFSTKRTYSLKLLIYNNVLVYASDNIVSGYSLFESDFYVLNTTKATNET